MLDILGFNHTGNKSYRTAVFLCEIFKQIIIEKWIYDQIIVKVFGKKLDWWKQTSYTMFSNKQLRTKGKK